VRIAHLVETLEVGGLERLAVDLAHRQNGQGHSARIYCIFEPGALASEAEQAGVPIVPFHKSKGFSPGTIRQIAARMKTDGIQILHSHNAVVHHYGVGGAILARVPVVVNTQHGFGNLSRPRQARLFRAVLPWTDAVALVSEDLRKACISNRSIPTKKAVVIHNGIPIAKFAEKRASPGSRRPHFRFGTVGRMVPPKNHGMLLEAFAKVLRAIPQAELHVMGDGPLREQLERCIAELSLSASVHLHGLSFDVADFLSTLDVFVLSSSTEGLPVVILEAMAAGLPIVSTRVGGVPEAAPEKQVAWYSPIGDCNSLAAAMYEAAQSSELAVRGETANRLATERFSIEAMADSYNDLYARLLNGQKVRR
jgi:glycosyltransferase involved in cell wall biosynthesis